VNQNLPVNKLPLIGQKLAAKLNKLNIASVGDLIRHYPSRHLDLTNTTVKATVVTCRNVYTRFGKTLQKATVRVNDQIRELTWFNQPWLPKTLKPGLLISLAGEDLSPDFEVIKTGAKLLHTGRLVPIYPETAGISSKWLRTKIALVLKTLVFPKDLLPENIKKLYQLIDQTTALRQIHFPDNPEKLASAKKRLAFDELFWAQLKNLYQKQQFKKLNLSYRLKVNQEKVLKLISSLPFQLTDGQKQVGKEILTDLDSSRPMNRLLQGDVGSGKTVVAAIAAFIAFDNGYQTVFMAPTQILASQHFNTLQSVLADTGLKLQLVTAGREKTELTADILIGTQALLHRKLAEKKLGLIVIDEQHRFGVKQRGQLQNQGKTTPHLLTMTATPIPRTVALTVYGNLDLSTLDELPAGRKLIKTWLVNTQKQLSAWHWVSQQVEKHLAQVFIVYPLIDPSGSETLADVKAATAEYETLKAIFKPDQLGLIHGRLKAKVKQAALNKFRDGETRVLVATPVIEVGIDVPNASIMVIVNAERFGLAQLHQLRGRVGRAGQQGYCLLFSGKNEAVTIKRLDYLTKINSGLKLAEMDLKLRGPGQLYGTVQHGFWQFKLADLADSELVSAAYLAAKTVLNEANPALLQTLKRGKIGIAAFN